MSLFTGFVFSECLLARHHFSFCCADNDLLEVFFSILVFLGVMFLSFFGVVAWC